MTDGDLVPSCVFCAIAQGRAHAKLLFDEDDVIVFKPLNPVVDGHVLVVPRTHAQSFVTDPALTARVAEVAARFTRSMDDELGQQTIDGFNLITSDGAAATQSVWHLHIHIVPRRHGDGLALPWTPATVARG